MKFEYEEFSTIEEFFLYLVSVAPYMKQVLPASSYKGYVFAFIPLGHSNGDVYLMIYAKGTLDGRILEFDINTKVFKKVNAIERADKTYFIVMTPKRNTIADQAIKNLS